ncbi:MAG: hypothetical protein ABR517_09715, partial [Thermoanaerobaculia bacterium]
MTNDSRSPSSDDYFLEVESHFAARRGTPFVFSAKDWGLLKGWKEAGIPLPVVLEAIDTCFEKKEAAGRKGVVSSLSYCRHAVKEIWADRQELQVGSSGSVPEARPEEPLAELSRRLRECERAAEPSAARVIGDAAEKVEAIPSGKSIPHIEDLLMNIESDLIAKLAATLSPEQAEA